MSGTQRRAGGGDRRGGRDGGRGAADKTAYIEKVVTINRVSKVVRQWLQRSSQRARGSPANPGKLRRQPASTLSTFSTSPPNP